MADDLTPEEIEQAQIDLQIQAALEEGRATELDNPISRMEQILDALHKERVFTTVAVVVVLLVLATVTWILFDKLNDTNATVDTNSALIARLDAQQKELEEQRVTTRKISCDADNVFRKGHNDFVTTDIDTYTALQQQTASPTFKDFLGQRIAALNNNIVRIRDCSPQGIEDYFNGTGGYLT